MRLTSKIRSRPRHQSNPRREKVAKSKKLYTLSKRRKFLIVSILLSLFLLVLQRIGAENRLIWLAIYSVFAYIASAWSLYKDLNGVEWITNLTLPTLFATSLSLFYFLLPQVFITQIIVMIFMAIGVYAILLTQNIFVVASIRTIQLIRAARAVGFLITIVTAALIFDVILSMRIGAIFTTLLVLVSSFLLFLQGLWSSDLQDRISGKVAVMSLVSSLIVSEIAGAMSFWLVDVAMGSILLSMAVYMLLGVYQHQLEGRLFRKTLQEYIGFGVIVFFIVATSVFLRWGS